jgi:hypothetical protein
MKAHKQSENEIFEWEGLIDWTMFGNCDVLEGKSGYIEMNLTF